MLGFKLYSKNYTYFIFIKKFQLFFSKDRNRIWSVSSALNLDNRICLLTNKCQAGDHKIYLKNRRKNRGQFAQLMMIALHRMRYWICSKHQRLVRFLLSDLT